MYLQPGTEPLTDCFDRFEAEIRSAAWAIAHAILAAELARRMAATPKPRRGRPPKQRKVAEAQLELVVVPPAAPEVPAAPAPEPVDNRKRRPWTKDRVVDELAQWLLEVPTLDAAFLGRRGQGAMVAAARRLFGRFEAAVNAASVHIAAMYPEGPPSKRPTAPSTLRA